MAVYSPLERAKKLLKARRFSEVIKELEPLIREYQDASDSRQSFEYFYTLGIACLYAEDSGGADTYFQLARKIKLQSPDLLLAFAVLCLRQGKTKRAVDYYLEVLDIQPGNKIAAQSLEFIRLHGDAETISQWVRNKKITRFYPPLGINPRKMRLACLLLAAGILALSAPRLIPKDWHPFRALVNGKTSVPVSGKRADLSGFVLSGEETKNAAETAGESSSAYRYNLTAKEITAAYIQAQTLFQNYRDNAAQVEVNRLLNSNASPVIRENVRLLMEHFKEPTFDSLNPKDNYPYRDTASDPALYQDCWVIWKGRVSNTRLDEAALRCDFLVGYDDLKTIEGIVPLTFPLSVDINPELAVNVLAKIKLEGGKISLEGKSVYQPVRAALPAR
ncbi:MAG: hypothetical protein LBS97_05700 [Treponema sp.]|jgi:hypothetical protein|nr:hypothetical protein [Treponema sp.]